MKKENFKKGIYLGKGLLLAYIITIILLVTSALLLTYSPIKEEKTALASTMIMLVSITAGSIYLTTKIREKGWLNGGVLGIGYYLILLILNFIFLRSLIIDLFSFTRLGITIIVGIIGGIIGINLSSEN